MPAVFVHGVPETATIWDGVRERIDRDSIALSLPGFGNPRPEAFGATKDDYVNWIAGQLEQIDGPIDLVGHDWGASMVLRIATARGELLRSWANDTANVFHPDYVWHEFAQIWQTPGDGEDFMDAQLALDDEARLEVFKGMGVPEDGARLLAHSIDYTMSRCILDLYRSAVPNACKDWGAEVGPTKAPGMMLVAPADPFGHEDKTRSLAGLLDARVEVLDQGLGHWWMLQDPDHGARVLTSFWASI